MKTKGQLLQVAELGNRALRERAKEVRDINDEKLQKLIDDLIARRAKKSSNAKTIKKSKKKVVISKSL
ncbi:MAG: hypothetical protein A3D92_13370 [Bacteroidetes bacterium RIFCSPHIGHO2_02_FULL_44_7]|uniref:Uncharacterized protein n=3 Tax=Candidatus Roizmaniibacteriota TaxID=1752723 RepID=A0A1F7JQW6_9BACT|nr:MAG: hypothetical protein A3D92_13370 [Bacteroidetes bacterium RIFCSPHIGHO2_02_FULL_44_7]OGK38336.1 MAG: hypothetical protein A3F03_02090 [Candidatus Roizmanbacteria bacterium RIFCSPHIGHO2_12_FULL_41_11]OGK51152.1 MAG: hypothetical protein A2966_00225 [Candidatus Roizmanbacteria bacterium RIFCSPLOWO2_01_FULL_41_22]OGK58007.1 MAG: hypothetical protein A3H86_00775 [Candidatus Roizmanbacteria bacterium RIFCSPLOWO2_02_FULL_41_9]